MKKKSKIIIIDGNNNLHRAYHKFKGMTSKKGVLTNIIYGFPYIISGLIKKLNPTDVYMVFDGGKDKNRLNVLPTYKQREPKLDFDYENFIMQKKIAMKIMTKLGIKVIHKKDTEADDWIWLIAKQLIKEGHKEIIIVSTDKDFVQLICNEISIWNTTKKMRINKSNVEKAYGFNPKQCVDFLCLDGDKSDKIPGYSGMGPKTIAKFFEEHSSIRKFLKEDSTFKKLDKELLVDIYKRNRTLIDIKYFCRRYYRGVEIPLIKGSKRIDYNYLSKISIEYDINTFSKYTFLKPFKQLIK